jgi:hypothetical protein
MADIEEEIREIVNREARAMTRNAPSRSRPRMVLLPYLSPE